MKSSATEALNSLLKSYAELNPPKIVELFEEPSPLEFLRYVAINRPVVIRGSAKSFDAYENWEFQYLHDRMHGQSVNVSSTSNGKADSPTVVEDELWFVKPNETSVQFEKVLREIIDQEYKALSEIKAVKYAQTQNDNLRGEYETLFADVPKSIPFARIALGKDPDAINFWLGNSHSTTALHKDPYENIYVQIRGHKHFTLLPPIAVPAVNEQRLKAATYDGSERPVPVLDEPPEWVPFPTWDPESPKVGATPFARLVEPIRVTLDPGDMLYLPALWFHRVGQSAGEEGFVCAVNYWYDMDFSGTFFATSQFVRDVSRIALGETGHATKQANQSDEP